MYVLIHASMRAEISFALVSADAATVARQTYAGENKDVITYLVSFLDQHLVKKEDVLGIGVVEGVGGFTSTRIATLVANVFAYVQNIPVIALSEQQFDQPSTILITAFASQQPGTLIHPEYSGEPNIRM